MNEWKFPWRHLMILIALAISALLAYDIHIHGSFKKSKTGNALKEVGMLAVCEQAWSRVTVYSGKVYQWLELNVPVYYSKVCHVCKPYVQLFWEKLFLLCIYLWDSTQWFRDWFCVAVPPLLQWCNDNFPVYMERIIVSIFEVCKILQSYSVWIWSYISYYLGIVGTWLAENVFTGSLSPANIQRCIGNAVEILQKYTISTYHWVSQQIFTIASSTK